MRCGMGSFAEGDVAGFSTTVPNCAKAVGVRSSMGIRIDGAGIDVGMFAALKEDLFVAECCGIVKDGEVELGLKDRSSARLACEGALR